MALGWIWGHPWCRGTLRGKRGAWRRSRRRTWRHASCFCVAGVALDNIDLPFAWQAWHLATSTCLLRGRRGTYGTGLDLVAHLVPLVARDIAPLCVAGVALGDIDLPFCVAGVAPSHIHAAYAWQAWHLLTHNSFTHITCTQLCHTHTQLIYAHTHNFVTHTHLLRNILSNYWCGMHRTCKNTSVKPDRNGLMIGSEKLCEEIFLHPCSKDLLVLMQLGQIAKTVQ